MKMGLRAFSVGLVMAVLMATSFLTPRASADDIPLGSAANFGLLFEGAGGNTLQITNVTVNGNVGVGMTGKATDSGPSTINGALDFSAANTGQFSNNNIADVITGGVSYNVAAVTNALTDANNLNTAANVTGTAVSIGTGSGQTLTINASAGMLQTINGVMCRVFTVTGFNTTNGDTLTINGDAAGDPVVLNFTSSVNFNNQVKLNGITPTQVLYNFVGGSGLTGGPTLQINDNLGTHTPDCALGIYCVQGIFLDPNGPISVVNANLLGDVFGGDTHDFQYVSGATILSPTVVTSPEPSSLSLFATGLLALLGLAPLTRRRLISGFGL